MNSIQDPFCAVLILLTLAGCRSLPDFGRSDFSAPGWQVRQGQAVWQPRRGKPELAGEALWGQHTNGQSVLHFTKTPVLLVLAESKGEEWRISFASEWREFGGRGAARARFGWLVLAAVLTGADVPPGWRFDQKPNGNWSLENFRTGERLEGYFTP